MSIFVQYIICKLQPQNREHPMLEDCYNLRDCEKLLCPLIQQISLIGEIPLTEEDVDKLGKLIRETIKTDKDGKWKLERFYQTCLACF
jgi:hypothetical protein